MLSLKKNNPWEGEINYFKAKNQEILQRLDELKKEVAYYEESHVNLSALIHIETRLKINGLKGRLNYQVT